MTPGAVSGLAGAMGIALSAAEIEACAPHSDGLSGGVSRLYAWRGRIISCHWAGVAHDCLYARGGRAADRKRADRLFRIACCRSGKPVPGWLQKMREDRPRPARLFGWIPPLRRAWRWIRAWIMYGAVRAFGRRYWREGGES